MDQIYYGIYHMLYVQADSFLYSARPDGRLRDQIDEAEREVLASRRLALRPDAKYLLFVNFQAMVRAPLLLAARVDETRIDEDTKSDLRRVMIAAADAMPAARRGQEEAREISGHQIIDAVSRVWTELGTLVHHAWD